MRICSFLHYTVLTLKWSDLHLKRRTIKYALSTVISLPYNKTCTNFIISKIGIIEIPAHLSRPNNIFTIRTNTYMKRSYKILPLCPLLRF